MRQVTGVPGLGHYHGSASTSSRGISGQWQGQEQQEHKPDLPGWSKVKQQMLQEREPFPKVLQLSKTATLRRISVK